MTDTIPTTFHTLARENTGAHFLDSGGYYGRQYDRPVPTEDQPLEYACGDTILISMPAMLDEQAPIDPRETAKFYRWARWADPRDDCSWFELAERYIARHIEKGTEGWEDQGNGRPIIGNTYNGESELDQDFWWATPDFYSQYAMICTHNGCDARGGYSRPVVVNTSDGIAGALCAMEISYYCPRCQDGAEGSYQAGEEGWRPRQNKHSVALVCPGCHKVAFRVPLEPGR
jgi:hypothetical protein